MLQFEKGFIMLCDEGTEEECLRRNLFGDKARRFQYLEEIQPGNIGFLLNISKDELIGTFRACSQPQLHIERDAWGGRFAAQIRIELIGKLQRINNATYILKKSGVSMIQLKSGAPAPQVPVHDQDVVEDILKSFDVPK